MSGMRRESRQRQAQHSRSLSGCRIRQTGRLQSTPMLGKAPQLPPAALFLAG